MSAPKTVILRAFNTQLFEFLDVMISYFPDRTELQTTKTSIEFIKKQNPTIIIKGWLTFFYSKYAEQINNGNFDFFLEKDYSHDMNLLEQNGNTGSLGAEEIHRFINELREPFRLLSEDRKNVVVQYVQNLSRFSVQYAL